MSLFVESRNLTFLSHRGISTKKQLTCVACIMEHTVKASRVKNSKIKKSNAIKKNLMPKVNKTGSAPLHNKTKRRQEAAAKDRRQSDIAMKFRNDVIEEKMRAGKQGAFDIEDDDADVGVDLETEGEWDDWIADDGNTTIPTNGASSAYRGTHVKFDESVQPFAMRSRNPIKKDRKPKVDKTGSAPLRNKTKRRQEANAKDRRQSDIAMKFRNDIIGEKLRAGKQGAFEIEDDDADVSTHSKFEEDERVQKLSKQQKRKVHKLVNTIRRTILNDKQVLTTILASQRNRLAELVRGVRNSLMRQRST